MAIEAGHPGVFAYRHGGTTVLWVPADGREPGEVLASWLAHDSWRRGTRGPRWLVAVCLLLPVAAAVAVLVLAGGYRSPVAVLLAVAVVWLGAALLHGLVTRRFDRRPALVPPQRLPARPLADELRRTAPADTPADRLAAWNDVVRRYRDASAAVGKGRRDAALPAAARRVSPGDRSTWYYEPGDLPALEQEFADAASAARPLAQELGFELDEAPGLRQPGR